MKTFKNLKSIYKYLEENILNYKHMSEISKIFQDYRDLKFKEKNITEVQIAQWEIDFLSFVITDNKLQPMTTYTDDKGMPGEYPNLKLFDDKTYKYLIKRFESTNNPLLKTRYSHILWHSPEKNIKYAQEAINSYLQLLEIYKKKDKEFPDKHYGLYILISINNAYYLATQVKYKIKKIKSIIKYLITRYTFKSGTYLRIKKDIIELMIEEKKKFTQKNFIGLEKVCIKMADMKKHDNMPQYAIDLYKLGEKIDFKTGKKTHNWNLLIAESYEKLIDTKNNKNSFITLVV